MQFYETIKTLYKTHVFWETNCKSLNLISSHANLTTTPLTNTQNYKIYNKYVI